MAVKRMNNFKLIFIKISSLFRSIFKETYDDRNYARKQKSKNKWEKYLAETGFEQECKDYLENVKKRASEELSAITTECEANEEIRSNSNV